MSERSLRARAARAPPEPESPSSSPEPAEPREPRARRRPLLSLHDKMKIIGEMEKGARRVDIARVFGVSPSTAAYVYSRKEALVEQFESKFGAGEERGGAAGADPARALLRWFESRVEAGERVGGPAMRRKAEEIAAELGCADFHCTDEWLSAFNASHNIVKDTRTAEEAAGPSEWFDLDDGYDERDVFVAGGASLYYDVDIDNFASRILASKNHLSLFVATNVTGTDKYRLSVVGKYSSPKPFESVRSLPIYYTGNDSGLITRNFVANFICQWDSELKTQGKNVLLLVENNELYDNIQMSGCIKIVTMQTEHSNTHKMFGKVLKCLKYHYRRLQIMHNLSHQSEQPHESLLHAVRLLNLAWNSVTQQTIYSAFHPPTYGCLYFDTKTEEQMLSEENDECSLSKWLSTYNVGLELTDYSVLDQLLQCDNDLKWFTIEDSMASDEINKIAGPDESNACENNSPKIAGPDESNACENNSPKMTAMEAFGAIKRLIRYLQSVNALSSTLDAVGLLENHVEYGVLMEIYKDYKRNLDAEM